MVIASFQIFALTAGRNCPGCGGRLSAWVTVQGNNVPVGGKYHTVFRPLSMGARGQRRRLHDTFGLGCLTDALVSTSLGRVGFLQLCH